MQEAEEIGRDAGKTEELAGINACAKIDAMSELLAALPRIFGLRTGDDYAPLVKQAGAEAMLARVVEDTNRQLIRAYETTLAEVAKEAAQHTRHR